MSRSTAELYSSSGDDADQFCESREGSHIAVTSLPATLAGYQLDRMATLLNALGDLTRLRLMAALLEARLCTCDLAALLGVTESAVSHQLRLLKNLNLVRSQREGKCVYHELSDDHVRMLISVAAEHVAEESI